MKAARTITAVKLPAYDDLGLLGAYRIVRHTGNNRIYLSWYDPSDRQTKRISLMTDQLVKAVSIAQDLADKKVDGNPRLFLQETPLQTVAELLDWDWESYRKNIPSAEAAGIAVKILKSKLGDRRMPTLVPEVYDKFRDDLKAEGRKIGYVSRILSTLRSAGNRALQNNRIPRKLVVPEFVKRKMKKHNKPKGPILTTAEIAAIIDKIGAPHLLLIVLLLIYFGTRIGALLDLTTDQIDLGDNVIDFNPPGRDRTNKGRPILPISGQLLPWLMDLPNGPIISYRGKRIMEADSGFLSAIARAKIQKKANFYSIRHTLSRYMRRQCKVDLEEIGIYLGHGEPDPDLETTLIYCPWEPDYLMNCRDAADAFVREINTHTKKWDLLTPYRVKPGYREDLT